jgi:hypothetical protein
MPTVRHYELHPLFLEVESTDEGVFRAIEALFDGFFTAAPPVPEGAALFRLTARTVSAADELPLIDTNPYSVNTSHTPTGGVTSRLMAGESGLRAILLQDVAVTRYDLAKGAGEACVVRDRWGAWGFQALIPMLSELLALQGLFLLHCGASLLPDSGDCILFFGASGAGKTTSVQALAQQYLPLICDDAGFLSVNGAQCLFRGLPRASKVHRHTLDLLPQLRKLHCSPIPGSEEFIIGFRSLPGVDPCRAYPVRALFLLEPRNSVAHRITPLDPLAMLPQLAEGNLRVMEPSASGSGGSMFRALGTLCRYTPGFSLSVGPSLSTLKSALLTVLDTVSP